MRSNWSPCVCVFVSMASARDQFSSVPVWPASKTKRKRRKTDEESVFDTNERKRIMVGKRNEEILCKRDWTKEKLPSERAKQRRKTQSFVQQLHTHTRIHDAHNQREYIFRWLFLAFIQVFFYRWRPRPQIQMQSRTRRRSSSHRAVDSARKLLLKKVAIVIHFSFLFWIFTFFTFLCWNTSPCVCARVRL